MVASPSALTPSRVRTFRMLWSMMRPSSQPVWHLICSLNTQKGHPHAIANPFPWNRNRNRRPWTSRREAPCVRPSSKTSSSSPVEWKPRTPNGRFRAVSFMANRAPGGVFSPRDFFWRRVSGIHARSRMRGHLCAEPWKQNPVIAKRVCSGFFAPFHGTRRAALV